MRDQTFRTSTRRRGGGGLEICHVFTDSIVFKQHVYCLFLQMKDRWVGVVCKGHNCMMPNIKTYFDKKSNIFSFDPSVTVKQWPLLLNICTFKMKNNLKTFLILNNNTKTHAIANLSSNNYCCEKKLKICQEWRHLVSGRFTKMFYKTTTCPRRPLLSGPKSGHLIYRFHCTSKPERELRPK